MNTTIRKTVKPSQLKFKVYHRGSSYIISAFRRWMARYVAAMVLNSSLDTYQFGGYTGHLRLNYYLIDADKEQLAHWILYIAGYVCSVTHLKELTGGESND